MPAFALHTRRWSRIEVPAKLLCSAPVRSVRARKHRDVTVLSNDSREAPANQRHWRHESVTQDGKADASPGRVWIFEASSDVQSIRPKKRGSCRDEPDTPLAHRRPEYPLAGCFPAEPASVSSGNVISTQDSRERNNWTSEDASKNPSLRWSRSAIWVRRTRSRTGIATFQNGSTGSGILAHFLAQTDIGSAPAGTLDLPGKGEFRSGNSGQGCQVTKTRAAERAAQSPQSAPSATRFAESAVIKSPQVYKTRTFALQSPESAGNSGCTEQASMSR